ncbi:MAG: hypothetical protein WD266_10610 [Balneolales bacterium]
MDRNKVAAVKNILMDPIYPGATEIDDTELIHDINDLPYPVKFRSGTIIDKVTCLKMVFGPPVKWHDHRETVDSIWKTFSLHDESKI